MPLVIDPESYSEELLVELVRSLRADLEETMELASSPRGPVLDPSGLETAQELARAALAVLGRAPGRSRTELAAEANLAYSTLLAVVDLVKSHTDVPKVPRARKSSSGT